MLALKGAAHSSASASFLRQQLKKRPDVFVAADSSPVATDWPAVAAWCFAMAVKEEDLIVTSAMSSFATRSSPRRAAAAVKISIHSSIDCLVLACM
jgi:hypothetical protein